MAAAAYAATLSLLNVLDNLQHPARQHLRFDRNQIETLRDKASFLFGFIEDYSEILCDTGREDLARKIADVADEAEHVIDSHVVDQLSQRYANEADLGISSCYEDVDRVLNKIEFIKEELMMVKNLERAVKAPQPRVSLPAAGPSAPPSSGKNTMVGFDEHLVRIMGQLAGDESSLQIIPIVGMGGIGKTTLAKNVFDNQRIVDRFDKRVWVTISQSYSIREILLRLCNVEGSSEDTAALREQLHRSLFGRRYFIVIDDVWSTEVWDDFKMFFPENRNGSRIIVTTRLSNVADSLGNHKSYLIDFLDEEKSWKLFCEKAFGREGGPDPELEEIGKKIAKNCNGLPLAIVVIGGLLSNSNMTREYWEKVADNVNSFINSRDDEHCLNILSLSYEHLPIHLKSCFLYMRIFPEDAEILVSRLIKFWVADGFVKSRRGKTLEEVACEYLKDLIGRNLILIHEFKDSGKMKTCKIHDILWDLCLREYEKEHIFHISKVQWSYLIKDGICFLCLHRDASETMYLPHVPVASQETNPSSGCFYVCDICANIYSHVDRRSRLVRVIESSTLRFLQPARLRYLQFRGHGRFVFASLPLLWNLQYLIIFLSKEITLPCEIWEMPQLRHLEIYKAILPDPPVTRIDKKDFIILENLQSLCRIRDFRCSEEIVEKIPNLKKLDIFYRKTDNWSYYQLRNLSNLHKLESLDIEAPGCNPQEMAFPHSLKKLALDRSTIRWEEISTFIGSLPNLEVLRLSNIKGAKWNPVEGDFLQLKSLTISNCPRLMKWNAEKNHFPKLEMLEIYRPYSLGAIPSGIGELETLRSIRLIRCPKNIVKSAKKIIEEQRSYGNEDLQLHVKDY